MTLRGKANIYELHKNGKCVMTGTSRELGKCLGLGPRAVTQAYQEGYNVNGYVIFLGDPKESNSETWRITPEMWKQWDDICMVFRSAYSQRI